MFESSAQVLDELEAGAQQLRSLAAADADALTPVDDQLRVENAIAAGVAVLASEPMPTPATTPSDRRVLARDLLITAELVARAMRTHS